MSRLNIPIDVLTSRLNLSERFDSVRSQSITQRFSNLKPISEFLDFKRLSKPRDFGDVQARVNYNLGYFSSNYAVIFVMLSIYALLTNTWLLFDIVFVSASMWIVGRLGGRDLEIGSFRATTSQLYTGIACISVPIAIFSGPIGTFLWLTYRECFFRGGGLGGRPRTPYDVPRWGRPPGARLGRQRGGVYGVHQSWNEDDRVQEVGTEDEDNFLRHDPRYAYEMDDRFYSDELLFDGIDPNPQQYMGHRRMDGYYYDDSEFEGVDEYYMRDKHYPLERTGSRQSMLAEKEEELVARALERIARARALGKTDVKLSQAEIDALERLERSKPQQKVSQAPAMKALPTSKKTLTRKAAEASTKNRGTSPKARLSEGRVRNHSNASSRSAREDDLPTYPIPQDSGHTGRPFHPPDMRAGYQGSPLRPAGSRSNSYGNIRQTVGPPPLYAPYYQNQRFASMPEGPYHRRGESAASTRLRADSGRSDQSSRSRSNSQLRSYPVDQLPNLTQTARAPRFDPNDPRFASPRPSPGRRPRGSGSRRQSDDLYPSLADEPEVINYMVSGSSRSSSDSDGTGPYHEPTVTVEVAEKPGAKAGYSMKTRSAAAASGTSKSKSGAKASVRRR
ncbi:hypothetical protein LTS08_006029 [Lithohypha guttulata]|uniref:uncharacterized protein n=1 Tax=Lithohypha guttulata TaxID=1690604 RepID=UPI002DDFED19|nr:hypothetical protein LTR51_002543 [Lithohypha guttulata]KAK5099447.1 hypothetical protein LTS08_006029 [Lithohypha guttulata]